MKRFTNKKVVAVVVTVGLVAGGGGVAFAYFTSSGTGSGSATVAGAPGTVFHMTTTGPVAPLVPGGGPQAFDISIHNISASDQYIGAVDMSVMTNSSTGDATTADGTDITGCPAAWFTIAGGPLPVDSTINASTTVTLGELSGAPTPPTIVLTETSTNQNACEGSSVGIAFSAAG